MVRTIDFGSVPLGSTIDRDLVITNTGNAALEIYSVELSGQGLESFTLLEAPETAETVTIDPQNAKTYTIRYTPQQAMAANVEVELITNDPENRIVKIALISQYKGTQDIETDPATLQFPDTLVGEQAETLCVTVKNVPEGSDDNKVLVLRAIRLESGTARNFELQNLPEMPVVLSPVQELSVCVLFHPILLGAHTDAIIIENDDPDEDEQVFRVPLSGEGVQPKIAVSPNPIQFNRVNIGLVADLDGYIENQGGAPLTVTGLTIQGAQAERFGFAVQTPANGDGHWVVEPNGRLPVRFTFTPTEEGSASADLVIANDDPDHLSHSVGMLGYGAYGSLRSEPTFLGFPLTRVGEVSTMALRVINQGDINVIVTGFDFGGETAFATQEPVDTLFPFELSMNGANVQREVILTFSPTEERTHNATILVQTNDPNLNFTIAATGIGGLPHYASTPEETAFDMGEVRLGDTVTLPFTVRNIGTYPMIVQDVILTAGSDPAFSLIDPPATAVTLDPGQTLPISVRFHLDAGSDTGMKHGAFSLRTDDTDFLSVTINLQARAINPQLLLSPEENPYDFGSIMVGDQSAPVTFRLRNVGVGDLTITNIEMTSGDDWFVLSSVPDFTGGPLTLRPMSTGDMLSFTATFIPVGFSPYEAEVRIYTNSYGTPVTLLQFQGVGQGCPEGQHMCNLVCYSNFSVETCGTRCPGDPCPLQPNTTATCDGVDCGYECFPQWWLDCNGERQDGCEINTYTNLDHCGGCFQTCDRANASETCQLGVCTLGACERGYDNCDEDADNGCETNIFTDLQNCGDCNEICDVEGAEEICENGICQMASCEGNFRDCNTNPTDGCETDVMSSSLQHCGACYQECDLSNAQEHCESGVCSLDACIDPYRNCNNDKDDGCEINTHTDIANCGECFQSCHLDHVASHFCVTGTCRINECSANYANCNGTHADGCEVSLLNDTENCGSCNRVCDLPNGINICNNGSCQIGACSAPFDDCTAQPGCETNLYEDPYHCGGCDRACNLANAVPICALGDCQVGACIGTFANCNNQNPDGCEVDTATNTQHCGACGTVCDLPNAETHQCAAGSCQVVQCEGGYSNCNGLHPDGCEIHVSTDIDNCGACGNDCDLAHADAHTCVGGSCRVSTCDSGYANCNGTHGDGCETHTDRDVLNCGACNNACNLPNVLVYTCLDGACGVGECAQGWADCTEAPGCETRISQDAQNCGACGNVCDLPGTDVHMCVSGVCQVGTCDTGFGNCNGQPVPNDGCEVNLQTSTGNCGGCGQVCDLSNTQTHACVDGSCQVAVCDPGFDNCNGLHTDGCEINFRTDVGHCGACDAECDLSNTNAHECYNGTCRVVSCDTPYANCDGQNANGCEVNLNTDTAHCGQCYGACNLTNTDQHACVGGACQVVSCDEPFGNCNGQPVPNDGCETNTGTAVSHCGACGTACNLPGGTNTCVDGSCEISGCFDPLADCTAGPGCETNTDTSNTHCGGCNQACAPANASGQCADGTCRVTLCTDPFANCNGNDTDGCEVNTDANTNHCGACGTVCNLPNVIEHSCTGGVCGIVTCAPGFDNCNGVASDGCEVNLQTDVNHCGGCAASFACALPNVGVHECVSGTCRVVSCSEPYRNCDGQNANGCEVNAATNTNHCGACFHECALPNATAHACVGGACQVTACQDPYGNCNGQPVPNDGCETNTDTAVSNCGACGTACNLPGGTNVCADGSCEISSCADPFADCTAAPGCETNTDTSLSHCGGCAQPCAPANANGQCVSGACTVASCIAPFANCNGNAADGCEVNTNTTTAHCGACGNVCNLPHVAEHACTGGACAIVTCAPGYRDCNGVASDGCEVDINTNTSHCGACLAACDLPNTNAHTCVAGSCRVSTCDTNYANCNGQHPDGCETNTQTNVDHCGSCSNECALPNASAQACVGGACQVVSCTDPYGNCNSTHPDGCEVNTDTNVSNCGACGTVCNLPNAVNACVDGGCAVGSCNDPYADCTAAPGCETNTNTSLAHCGGCAQPCAPANASGQCVGGSCTVASCTAPFANCNGQNADGCEVNTDTNANHCGACGAACNLPNVATYTCAGGTCGIGSCISGFMDCNGVASDGCEIDTRSNVNNCGGCGTVCDLANTNEHTCNAGVCQVSTCDSGFENCNTTHSDGCEIDTRSNVNNCGGCGTVCDLNHTNAHTCNAGVCQVSTCDSGYANCNNLNPDGCEINTQTNTSNCGACGAVCNLPNTNAHSCVSGSCQVSTCDSGFANCNNLNPDGCEVNTLTNTSNCGACGAVCNLPNTDAHSCVSGSCQVGTCDSGFANCNNQNPDGCEINTTNNLNNCGACGIACSLPNANNQCSNSVCSIASCIAPYGNCDGNTPNGCETNTTNNVNNCGACGMVCNLNNVDVHTCSSSTCGISTCDSGYTNCDASQANGCETHTSSDAANCGSCGYLCDLPNTNTHSCVSGGCRVSSCDSGYANCNSTHPDGCEINTTNNVSNCGSCGNICDLPHTSAHTCSSSTCQISSCDSHYVNCDSVHSNGCEIGLGDSGTTENACSTSYSLGSTIHGDTDSNYRTVSSRGSKWYKVYVDENDDWIDSLEASIQLIVPSGVDYDITTYRDGCTSNAQTGSNGTGAAECLSYEWSDSWGSNDSEWIYVKVYHFSGSSCSNWTLTVRGNTTSCGKSAKKKVIDMSLPAEDLPYEYFVASGLEDEEYQSNADVERCLTTEPEFRLVEIPSPNEDQEVQLREVPPSLYGIELVTEDNQ